MQRSLCRPRLGSDCESHLGSCLPEELDEHIDAEPINPTSHQVAHARLRYAEEMREYFLRVGAPEWETAFVHAIHAHAAAVAGQSQAHAASYALATEALAAIPDEEDRRIVARTLDHVPKPRGAVAGHLCDG